MRRAHEWLAMAGLVLATVACGGAGSVTGPSATTSPASTYSVSGLVYETGGGGDQLSRGAEVLVVSSSGTRSAKTGLDGGYQMAGVPGGPARIVVRKPGYEEQSQAIQITENLTFTFRLILGDDIPARRDP